MSTSRLVEPEPVGRRAGEGDDLRDQPLDDRPRRSVVGGRAHHDRRELDRAAALRAGRRGSTGASSSGVATPKCAGTSRSSTVRRPPAVLAPSGGADRGEPDVVAAAPVAGDVAERGEANVPPVRADTDAVHAGAAGDGDAPAALGARAEHGERVVADPRAVRPATRVELLARRRAPPPESRARRA